MGSCDTGRSVYYEYMGEIKCDVLQKEYQEFKKLTEKCKGVLLQRGLKSTEYRAIRQQFDQRREHLQGLINERKEFFAHLRNLYFKNRKYIEGKWIHDQKIQEIFNRYGADREAFAYIFTCRPDQISFTEEEVLSGDVIFHRGNINLNDRSKLPQGVSIPRYIDGSLSLGGLNRWPQGVAMPKHISGFFWLRQLIEWPQGVAMPEYIAGDINLNSITELPEDIIMSKHIGEDLDLRGLIKWPKNVAMPKRIEYNIKLNSLTEWPENIIMPEYLGGSIVLNKELKEHPSAKNIPKDVRIEWV